MNTKDIWSNDVPEWRRINHHVELSGNTFNVKCHTVGFMEKLEVTKENVDYVDLYGSTFLWKAIGDQNVELVRWLVEDMGSNVNVKRCSIYIPSYLQAAVANRNVEIVSILVDNGADIDVLRRYKSKYSDEGYFDISMMEELRLELKCSGEFPSVPPVSVAMRKMEHIQEILGYQNIKG